MAGNEGLFVPPWYQAHEVYRLDMNVASIFWGISLATAIFSAAKASRQTWRTWTQMHRVTAYIVMVWGEWVACVAMSFLSWFHLWGDIEPGFWLWFWIAFIWCFQVQFLMQIIIDRIAVLMILPRRARMLRWTVFAMIFMINIAVFIVWIPCRLQWPGWVMVNRVWDRIEKSIFLIIDACLNLLFIHLVRTQLLAIGLVKYYPLFRCNIAMIFLSVSLDVALIGLMSLPTPTTYIQFQSLAYLVKLHVNMHMADLIRKIVRASNERHKAARGMGCSGGAFQSKPLTPPTIYSGQQQVMTSVRSSGASVMEEHVPNHSAYAEHCVQDVEQSESGAVSLPPPGAIQKTVVTTVAHHRLVEEDITEASDAGSTRWLTYPADDLFGFVGLDERGEGSSRRPSLKGSNRRPSLYPITG
ncbi:Uu.00g141680.m01.CDS01 [Anthostomella pinea]|uniref:Uu.00g141680.m01.CDS01 n=1 Tax=Anthostomella pinea TaxID=933095 RepID=A0AAI8VQC4_9PEZI|nr:Uu.00g141680.m01.CDS01 [Anthostomella pinea]